MAGKPKVFITRVIPEVGLERIGQHCDADVWTDPLPPGQVWAIGPGGADEPSGLYRIDVNMGPGSGVKIINVPPPGPFRESIK